jgi:arylsulfatase A-like enzyme
VNCIWITTDSFRQDHIHCYRPSGTLDDTGPSLRVRTPNLDQLATEGVRCNRLRSEALPTVPCRRGTFTGRRVFPWVEEPVHKGMYIHLPGWRPIPQEDVTVAEHLSAKGYTCAIVADVYHLMKPSQNFHRGFQSFEWVRGQEYDQWQSQPLPDGYLKRFLKPGTELTPARAKVLTQYLRNQFYREGDDDFQAARTFKTAIRWLERNQDHEKFFLYVDSFDPHEPFESPRRFLDLYDVDPNGPQLIYGNLYKRSELTDSEHHQVRARYAAACSMVDYWIGELLHTVERLGMHEDTMIVVVSDHGKILGEFGHYGMPPQDTSPMLNDVPCLLRHPGGELAGSVYDGWLYNTDIVATMLGLMGENDKPATDGVDAWSAMASGASIRDIAVTGHGPMIAAWRDDWLYLRNTDQDTAALYHLAEDAYRQRDVSSLHRDVAAELQQAIDDTLAGQ